MPRPVTRDEFRWLDVEVSWKHFLGRWQGRSCYALAITGAVPQGFARVGLRAWLGRVEPAFFYLAGRAKQIVEWHRDHRHCGRCGAPMSEHDVDRAMHCESCGLTSYPRISPSIIVLVRNGEEMLLARNARWPTGMFSTLAGFVERASPSNRRCIARCAKRSASQSPICATSAASLGRSPTR